MASVRSNSISSRQKSTRMSTWNSDGITERTFSTYGGSTRARDETKLRELAMKAGLPIGLPQPLLSLPEQRATPQNRSDKMGAERHLMALRKKRFLVGKSSKGFDNDEILLGLDQAIQISLTAPVIEAILQMAVSSGIYASDPGISFTTNKKGQKIPTMEYIFSQSHGQVGTDVWQLFLSRVSRRALDSALATTLNTSVQNIDITRVRLLLESGANPELCRKQILELVAVPGAEDLVEVLLLSPCITDTDFLSQALVRACALQLTRNVAMLLFRGADGNYSKGEALKYAISSTYYDIALAIALFSLQPVALNILDEATGLLGSRSRDMDEEFLLLLLYAGACGLRTSEAVTPYIRERRQGIINILCDSPAFYHGSFPTPQLFEATVELDDLAMALKVLRASRNRSFAEFMSTSAAKNLVLKFESRPSECQDIVAELFSMGVTGDYTSQMLIFCCQLPQIHKAGILDLVNMLIQNGNAKARFAEGKSVKLAIEQGQTAVLQALMLADPTQQVLSEAVRHASVVLERNENLLIGVWNILVGAGASGLIVDEELVLTVERRSDKAMRTLLPAASLDHNDGAAVMKAIKLGNLRTLQELVAQKAPNVSMRSIWKQTQSLFAISQEPAYELKYMIAVFEILFRIGGKLAPLDDLLQDATQCPSLEGAQSLSTLFIRWGASPNHALGVPLVACVNRSDAQTLSILLAQQPPKKALKYALTSAMTLKGKSRFEIVKLIASAGPEISCLDSMLPQILREEPYDASMVHLLLENKARIHASWNELLVRPAMALDLQAVKLLLETSSDLDVVLESLEAVLRYRTSWQHPAGQSLPMVTFLLSRIKTASCADLYFTSQVKHLSKHGAALFARHLTSQNVFDEALEAVLAEEEAQLTSERLQMITWLFSKGAKSVLVDATFLRATKALLIEWITTLDQYLNHENTRIEAFGLIADEQHFDISSIPRIAEVKRFLLSRGLPGKAVDTQFVIAAGVCNVKALKELFPYISSQDTLNDASDSLIKTLNSQKMPTAEPTLQFLLEKGVSDSSLQRAAHIVAKLHCDSAVNLILRIESGDGVAQALFQGLKDDIAPLWAPESRVILRSLISRGLDLDDLRFVVRVAVRRHDATLMDDVSRTPSYGKLVAYALHCLTESGDTWLSTKGLTFVQTLLRFPADTLLISKLAETAAKSSNLLALKIVQHASEDKVRSANAALAAFAFDKTALQTSEGLTILKYLLAEGASDSGIEQIAAHAAVTSNYNVIHIVLKSRGAVVGIPAAFRAVAHDKSRHLSSEQLSIASLLLDEGISTELLSVATVEVTKLLDIDALAVLSRASQFLSVTDDALRTLMESPELYCSPTGIQIMHLLFEIGVSSKSAEIASSKATAALNYDVLQVILRANQKTMAAQVSCRSLIGLGAGWLNSKGVRIMKLLLQQHVSQNDIDALFLIACEHLSFDAADFIADKIFESSVFSLALDKVTGNGGVWYSELHLVELILRSGIRGESVEAAFIKAAQALNLDALKLLSKSIDREEPFSKALTVVTGIANWEYSVDILKFLLAYGAQGEPVDKAYVQSAALLNYPSVELLGEHISNSKVHEQAFSAATSKEGWLSSNHLDLLRLLYKRGAVNSPPDVALALNHAAREMNLSVIEILSQQASPQMASNALHVMIEANEHWMNEEGATILSIFTSKGACGIVVEKILVQCAVSLRLDLVEVVQSKIGVGAFECWNEAFKGVISRSDWYLKPVAIDIIRILNEKIADEEVVLKDGHVALVTAAESGSFEAVQLLSNSNYVSDPNTYRIALEAFFLSGETWLLDKSYGLIEHLLGHMQEHEILDEYLPYAIAGIIDGDASVQLSALFLNYQPDLSYNNSEALRIAAMNGAFDLIKMLCEYATNPTSLSVCLETAFNEDSNDEEFVLSIIRHLQNTREDIKDIINCKSDGSEPVIFACLAKYPQSRELVATLCNLGADLSVTTLEKVYKGSGNRTKSNGSANDLVPPLLFALLYDASDEVIKTLLDLNAEIINYVPEESKANALILAASRNRSNILTWLIDLGADVKQRDCYGHTALFYASGFGDLHAMTSLMRKKSSVNDGSLHEAARNLKAEAVQTLVANGHGIDWPSAIHEGRTPLCELCANAEGTLNDFTDTLSEIRDVKADPLRKCRGKTPLFHALENKNAVLVVRKLIEILLWEDLNDEKNVFEEGNHSYSATMYIKKGLCQQPRDVAEELLRELENFEAADRYYAKERMEQPSDAVGMPQRIADLDQKRWIRSNRIKEDTEDHRIKIRRTQEEYSNTDQLVSNRHLQTLQHREDLAQQTLNHRLDENLLSMTIRARDHEQAMRYKDELIDSRLHDAVGTHRLKSVVDLQDRDSQLMHNNEETTQRLLALKKEQSIKFDGSHDQIELKLAGLDSENELKLQRDIQSLQYKAAFGDLEKTELDKKLIHMRDMNSDKVFTQDRLEDIARDSQRRKNAQSLEFQQSSDMQKLQTGESMLIQKQRENQETVRTKSAVSDVERRFLQDRHNISENDRQNQMRFNVASDDQRLSTLHRQSRIQNNGLIDKNRIMQQDRASSLQHTRGMGYAQYQNEISMGLAKAYSEECVGEQRIYNERMVGATRTQNAVELGQAHTHAEMQKGAVRIQNAVDLGNIQTNAEIQRGAARNSAQAQNESIRTSGARARAAIFNQNRWR